MTLSHTVRDPLRRRQSQISVTRCLWSALVTHSVPAKSENVRVLFCPQMHPSPRMLTQRTATPSSVVSGHLASHCPRLSYLGPHSTRKIVSWQQNSSEHCLWFPTKIRSRLNFLIPLKWLAEPGLSSLHRPYHAPTIKHTGGCHQNAFIREERLAAVFSISSFSYW